LKRGDRDASSGRFLPGNPGRPKGARHAALVALDAIGDEAAADVLLKVIQQAKAGDMRAAEILMRRLWPERKGRVVPFDLPDLRTAADAVQATGAVAHAVAAGELTPEEGQAVAAIVDAHRRTIETADLAARIDAIEARQAKERG
jgi:hypothetical protein